IANFANAGVAAQYEIASVLEDSGKRGEADAAYRKITDNYVNGLTRAPNDILWVAQAARATDLFHDANDLLKIVTAANPRNAEAFAIWGDLLEEKFNEKEASESYQDALK